MSKEEFKILDPREHVRLRPGMYLGSTSLESHERFLNGVWSSVSYVPAIVKMVDEIIDNCIDEAIRTNFKHANKISIHVDQDFIQIEDNGRGIPIEDVQTPDGEILKRPVAAWTKMNAGTSFVEDRTTIGANGLGSAAVNYMSEFFEGKTSDGNKSIKIKCRKGITEEIEEGKLKSKGTSVLFIPDFSIFDLDTLFDFDLKSIVEDRLKSLSISFPKIKFTLNHKDVSTNIKKYSFMFLEKDNIVTKTYQSNDFDFFICSSNDGFKSTSYVNGVNTRLGGSLVDNVINGIADELIVLIKKKHKITVNRSLVKGCLTFVSFARNLENPKFDSQTKERLTNTQKEITTFLSNQKIPSYDKIAKDIFDEQELINPIIEAQLAKKLAAEKRAATLAQKKLKKVKVAKHVPANKPGGTLFLCEGESALGFGVDVRDTDIHGFYPLKGVVMNTWNATPKKILENKELSELVAILGLDINKPEDVDSFYETITIMTDADHDGSHIAILLIGFIYRFWPKIIEEGRLKWLRTPIMISSKGKSNKWFYSYSEAKEFKEKNENWKHRHIKGLAGLEKDEYDTIINDPVYSVIDIDESMLLEDMLGENSDVRKQWINGE